MPGRSEAPPGQPGRLEWRLWLIVSGLLLLNAISQGLVSGTAERDQAEQLLLSQSWQLGYGPQPPLYTYLVKLLFLATGPALGPLLGLKAVLLSLLVGALLGIGRELRFSGGQQVIAVCGLALVPQLIWESQRDLTHSVLATAVAALTLLQLLRLQRRPGAAGYAGLGVLAAAGLLSKYSFGVFLASLALAALSLPAFRRVLLRPQLILTLMVGTALLGPHLGWLLDHGPLALGGLDKLEAEGGLASRLRGLFSATVAAAAFLAPLAVAAVALLWRSPRARRPARPGSARTAGAALVRRLPLALAGVLLVVILASGASRFKDRWYQPLLFYAPVTVALLAEGVSRQRRRALVAGASLAGGLTAVLLPGRIALAGLSGQASTRNAPLIPLLHQLRERHPSPSWIVASGTLLGGNTRQVFHTTPVLTPKVAVATAGAGGGLVLIDRKHRSDDVKALLRSRFGLRLDPEQLRPLSAPLLWGRQEQETYTIRYAWIEPKRRE